jgi:hypothetical protein
MVSAHHAPIGPPIRGPTMYGIISVIVSVPQCVITVAKRSPRSLAGLMLALENISSPRSSCTRVGERVGGQSLSRERNLPSQWSQEHHHGTNSKSYNRRHGRPWNGIQRTRDNKNDKHEEGGSECFNEQGVVLVND